MYEMGEIFTAGYNQKAFHNLLAKIYTKKNQ